MINGTSVAALDLGYLSNGLEHLAGILLTIIIAKIILGRPGIVPKRMRGIIWGIITLWSVTVILNYSANLYNYIHSTRAFYVRESHTQTGL
jgi:hypothetical protein